MRPSGVTSASCVWEGVNGIWKIQCWKTVQLQKSAIIGDLTIHPISANFLNAASESARNTTVANGRQLIRIGGTSPEIESQDFMYGQRMTDKQDGLFLHPVCPLWELPLNKQPSVSQTLNGIGSKIVSGQLRKVEKGAANPDLGNLDISEQFLHFPLPGVPV